MKKKIIKKIQNMSGSYSPYVIFTDWVEMMALSIQNSIYLFHNSIWQMREQQYLGIIKKYDKKTQHEFTELCAMLTAAYEEEGACDLLGEIYMEAGCGNKQTGQFFTPFHLSELCAQLSIGDVDEEHKLILNEPSTGGGGMILAAAKVLRKKGINYQRCMDVTAQDLDWKGVYMSYVQFSLLGIPAIVVQGDTLCEPFTDIKHYQQERVFITPAKMGVLTG